MTVDSTPLSQRPNLVSQVRFDGVYTMIGGALALVAGVVLTLIGLVGPCFLLLAPVLAIAGVILIPMGAWSMVAPLSNRNLARLGATADERRRAIAAIEDELMSRSALHGRMGGKTVSVTDHWIVVHGSGLLVVARDDLLYAHLSTTSHRKRGRETRRSHKVVVRARGGRSEDIETDDEDTARDVVALLAVANPRALLGYRAELARATDAELIALQPTRADAPPRPASRHADAPPRGDTSPTASGDGPIRPEPKRSGAGLLIAAVVAAVVGLPAMGFALFTCGCGGLVGLGAALDAQIDPLRRACDGVPAAGASPAQAGPDAGLLMFERATTSDAWLTDYGPYGHGLRDESKLDAVAVVGCVERPEQSTVEVCPDGRERARHVRRLRVVHARTAAVLIDTVVAGALPPPCGGGATLGPSVSQDEVYQVVRAALGGG